MKEQTTMSEKMNFRYLKEKDLSNPHFQIACFFGCDEVLESFRFETIDLLKTACSDQYYGNKGGYYYKQQQLVKLLELAYVLKYSEEDFKLDPCHPLHRPDDHSFELYTESKNTSFPALHFRTLSGKEVNNVRLFFEDLFHYKSLDVWTSILDAFLQCTTRKTSLEKIHLEKLYETILIREYLEKLIEAMALVFETKSLPYINTHHAGDFRIKVEEEENTALFNPIPVLKFAEKNFPAAIRFITDVVAPEKIFCLNHHSDRNGEDHADLVLVIPEKHRQTFEEIETLVNFTCLRHHHLSCTLFKSSFFHNLISEGHIYFSMACDSANLLYDDGSKALPKLRLDYRPEKIEKTKQAFYKGLIKAKTFLTAARGYREDNFIMSAFMLHQATELCLRALNRTLTTQDKTTHSLTALLKFSLRLSTKIAGEMNSGSDEDERLLMLLEEAYLGYRYSEKYSIEINDLNTLIEKVETLHNNVEEVFLTWMEKYDQLIKKAQNDH